MEKKELGIYEELILTSGVHDLDWNTAAFNFEPSGLAIELCRYPTLLVLANVPHCHTLSFFTAMLSGM